MREVLFSELVNKPKDTVAKLGRSRDLRLRRRDDEDLMLTTAARAEQNTELVSATTRMFVALMRHDDRARALLLDVIPEAFPWVKFLLRDSEAQGPGGKHWSSESDRVERTAPTRHPGPFPLARAWPAAANGEFGTCAMP